MDKAQALQQFWGSFELPAYDANTVPDDADLPRITYEVVEDAIDSPVQINASLWYRGTSWAEIEQKTMEVATFIGRGGEVIKIDGGYAWIKRGEPFAQRMSDEDDTIRRMYLTTEVEFLTEV